MASKTIAQWDGNMGTFSLWHWLILLFAFTLTGWLVYAIYKSIRQPKPESQLVGLGGWLIFIGLGLLIGGLRLLMDVNETYSSLFKSPASADLITPGSPTFNSPVYYFIYSEVIMYVLLALFSFLLLVLFFNKKRIFPTLYVVFLIGIPVLMAVDVIVASILFPSEQFLDSETIGMLIGSVIAASIWIAYMRRSRRVKLTFTR
jgi:hypothetical protein